MAGTADMFSSISLVALREALSRAMSVARASRFTLTIFT